MSEVMLINGAPITSKDALNSALSTSFEVIGAPFRNSTSDIQAGDVYYANGLWSRPADRDECAALSTPTGIVAPVAAKETGDTDLTASYVVKPYTSIKLGDVYYSKGFWSLPTSSVVSSCTTESAPIGYVAYLGSEQGATNGFIIAMSDLSKAYWPQAVSSASSYHPSGTNSGDFGYDGWRLGTNVVWELIINAVTWSVLKVSPYEMTESWYWTETPNAENTQAYYISNNGTVIMTHGGQSQNGGVRLVHVF